MLIVKFSLSKNYGFLCLVQKCSKLKKVVLLQQCLLQVELTSCKASAVLFHRKKAILCVESLWNIWEMFQNNTFNSEWSCLLHLMGIKTSAPLSFFVYTLNYIDIEGKLTWVSLIHVNISNVSWTLHWWLSKIA